MKIVTHHVFPPIPDRSSDWMAVDDDSYDGEGPVGTGPTEDAAIVDLLLLLDGTVEVIALMSALKTPAEWRAMADGKNALADAVYLEVADEIESGYIPDQI